MRELVYLSERKLRQFRAPRKKWRFSIREFGFPGIGQVGVDQPAESHLDAVIAHLEGMARWYEEKVPVGQWVHFEARLGQRVISNPSGIRALLFAEPRGHTGARRLVLHGSPDHLMDYVPEPPTARWGDDLPMDASLGEMVRPLMKQLASSDGWPTKRTYRSDLKSLTKFLDRELDPHTAAWMAGYARVTVDTVNRPVVLASPLYVEYVPPPDQ